MKGHYKIHQNVLAHQRRDFFFFFWFLKIPLGFPSFPGRAVVKNPPTRAGDAGDPGSIPGWKGSPGGGNDNPLQCSCLKILWTEEPGRLQSVGSQRVSHNCVSLQTHIHNNTSRLITMLVTRSALNKCLLNECFIVCFYHLTLNLRNIFLTIKFNF